jgi:ribosomal protein S18 acetylase RimI-like enzyme
MKIVPTKIEDAEHIAFIVSEANKDVAELFKINIENTPKHPSFYTEDWVLSDFKRGEEYFLYREDGVAKGCVAFEQPDSDTAYLNRLSVLPSYRHNGIGAALVRYIFDYSKTKNIQTVSIGIIAEYEVLKNWYLDLGFIEGDTIKFEHLPFNVKYMRYKL